MSTVFTREARRAGRRLEAAGVLDPTWSQLGREDEFPTLLDEVSGRLDRYADTAASYVETLGRIRGELLAELREMLGDPLPLADARTLRLLYQRGVQRYNALAFGLLQNNGGVDKSLSTRFSPVLAGRGRRPGEALLLLDGLRFTPAAVAWMLATLSDAVGLFAQIAYDPTYLRARRRRMEASDRPSVPVRR